MTRNQEAGKQKVRHTTMFWILLAVGLCGIAELLSKTWVQQQSGLEDTGIIAASFGLLVGVIAGSTSAAATMYGFATIFAFWPLWLFLAWRVEKGANTPPREPNSET